jgi:hypothetical protein
MTDAFAMDEIPVVDVNIDVMSDDPETPEPRHADVPGVGAPPTTDPADVITGVTALDSGVASGPDPAPAPEPGDAPAPPASSEPGSRAAPDAEASPSSTTKVPTRVDELLAEIQQTMAAERDRLTRQAWAEADAWAAEHLASEIERVRREADARLAREVERARAEEVARAEAALESTIDERVEQALAEAGRRHADEVARIKAEAEELLAQRFYAGFAAPPSPPEPARVDPASEVDVEEQIERARLEERAVVLSEIDRLRRTLSQLDDSRSLGEILETLGRALEPDVARLAIVRVADTGAVLWQAAGFSPPLDPVAVPLDVDPPRVIGRVVDSGMPSFANPGQGPDSDVELASVPSEAVALAVPVLVGGRVVAVVYADDAGRQGFPNTWPEVMGVLVNHASRCLEALSALVRASGDEPMPDATAFDGRCPAEDGGERAEPIGEARALINGSSQPSAAVERRASVRVAASELPWLGEVKIKPGHDAAIVDLSNGGALVEARSRLEPGTNVLLHFLGPEGRRVGGQVLRCAVYSFDDRRSVRYRGAVKFSEPLSEFFERAAATDEALAPATGTVELTRDTATASGGPTER